MNSLRMLNSMPPLETLICFEAVARCGSFTRAAREVALTQSAVSKQIKMLEELLGCQLVERHARGIALSAVGRDFLADIEPLLLGLHSAISKARHSQSEHAVSITCTLGVAHYWLFPRLVRFNQQYPDIKVSVLSSNTHNEHHCGESDLGILYGEGNWATLDSTPLIKEVIYPVCSPQLTLPWPETPADLCALPLIQLDTRSWDCIDWQDWFAHFAVEYHIPPNAIMFNQLTLTFNAAVEKLGVSLAWDSMARQAIASGTLKRLGDFHYETGNADFLVKLRNRPLTTQAATLYDWLLSVD